MLMCKPRCKFLVSTFFQIVANIIRCRERFFVLSRAWDREKILSLHKESDLRPSDSALRCATTEPQRFYTVGEIYYEVLKTRRLVHCLDQHVSIE